MVLGGRSLFAVAFDARQPSLWTGVIDRVQGVLSSTLSGSVVDFLNRRHREQHDWIWSSRESK